MKVFVLAIDGLEAKLVKKWNLKGLMQKEWGTHSVCSDNTEANLYTPILWAAFLLGENPETYGFSFDQILHKRMKVGYGMFYPLFWLRMKILGRKKLGIRHFLAKIGVFNINRVRRELSRIEHLPPELMNRTIVKEVEKQGYRVWIKEFPAYNDEKVAELRAYMELFFNKGLKERLQYLEEIYAFSCQLLEDALKAAKTNDLILYYTPLVDYANHMLYRPSKVKPMFHLARFYKRIEKMVERVTSTLEGQAVLVVSDHGYDPKKHEHSHYGFWSTNVPLEKKPEKITDFKSIIINLLQR